MVGRPKKPVTKIYRTLEIESENGKTFHLDHVLLRCPVCESYHIGENGTQKRKNTRVQGYKCKNSS